MICLPEIPFDPDHFIARVDAIQQQTPSLVVGLRGVRIAGRALRLRAGA